MDSMFDSMPFLYEMIEDDMRLVAMRCNSDSSSLCDEEQFALSNCSNMLDDYLFSASTSSLSSSLCSSNLALSLNSSLNASSGSASSATSSNVSSMPSSNISSPSVSLSPITITPSSFYDDINTFSSSKYNNQDSFLNINNNNNNTYQAINPSDLNLNLLNTDLNNQSQQNNFINNDNNDHCLYHKQPSSTIITGSTTIRNMKSAHLAPTIYTQPNKRGKFTNESQAASNRTPTICETFAANQMHQQQQKQQQYTLTTQNGTFFLLNSDGESVVSNESDSNSSDNYNRLKLSVSNGSSASSSVYSSPSLSPLSPQVHLNHSQQNNENNNNSNATLASITLKPTTITTTSPNGTTNHINIIKLKDVSSSDKHIIQYKQIITGAINQSQSSTSATLPIVNKSANTASFLLNGNSQNGNNNGNMSPTSPNLRGEKVYPKPPYSYSCLIAMALRNSDSGTLPVSDIYEFIIENFPYYKTARDGWKNSIRHNLSLNKCFEKIENPTNGSKKGCLWALNPEKCKKLEEECKRCRQRDLVNIRLSMSRPDDLNKIERGEQRIKKCNLNTQRKLYEAHQQHQQQASLNQHQTTIGNTITTTTTTSNNNNNSILSNGNNMNANANTVKENVTIINNDRYLIDWSSAKTTPTIVTSNNHYTLKQEPDDDDQFFAVLSESDVNFDSIILPSQHSQPQQQKFR